MQNECSRKFSICKPAKGAKAVCALLVLGFLIFTSEAAFAHKVYVFAWVEGDRVLTDSYFPDKRKVIKGKIKVLDPEGNVLTEGLTDEHGAFSFKVPQKSDLNIVLEAGMGHRAEFLIKAEELPGDAPLRTTPLPDKNDSVVGAEGGANIDLKELDRLVRKALEESLQPIERKLARLEEEQGPGLTEAMGGIGYILGLMGIVAYFRSRRRG